MKKPFWRSTPQQPEPDPSSTTPPGKRVGRVQWRVVVLVVSLSALGWTAWVGWPTWQRLRQIHTLRQFVGLAHDLERHRETWRRYPESLSELQPKPKRLTDAFGRRLLYLSESDRYLLISLGRDGESDGTNYWAARNRQEIYLRCAGLDSDQFVSDRGWHRRCGK
ncbi:MAG: hypothetical protein SF066_23645 [Thermoanaerobaculia bacterium]|nr:hypothetical protein [Thermoanaerobaculia bacterium]